MATAKPDLVPGTLDLLVMRTLRRGPLHGYAIARHIAEASRGQLTVEHGSLYPALYRLERRGHVTSRWRRSGTGRQVKAYRLTRTGRVHLRQQTESWSAFVSAVRRVLRSSG